MCGWVAFPVTPRRNLMPFLRLTAISGTKDWNEESIGPIRAGASAETSEFTLGPFNLNDLMKVWREYIVLLGSCLFTVRRRQVKPVT